MPENRHQAYSKSVEYVFYNFTGLFAWYMDNKCHSFINQYIFPGGYLPSITQLLGHISEQSHGTLVVEKVENIGGHYAKTLRLWNENFQNHFDSKIKPALLHNNPEMTKEAAEVFRRKWEVRAYTYLPFVSQRAH
jgi:cyclopropane-fatty-acyl-phospholipid synthase